MFGSRATGTARPSSDLDVAVWLDSALAAHDALRLRLALDRTLAVAAAPLPVDLVVLNDAPLLLRHRAMRDGRPVLDRDPLARVRLQTDTRSPTSTRCRCAPRRHAASPRSSPRTAWVDPDRVRSRLTRLDDALVFAALDDLRAFARAALDSAG